MDRKIPDRRTIHQKHRRNKRIVWILITSCIILAMVQAGYYLKAAGSSGDEPKDTANIALHETQPETEAVVREQETYPAEQETPVNDKDGEFLSEPETSADLPLNPEDAAGYFFSTELSDEIKARITGISYPDTEEQLQISYDDLAYVHVLHYDFDGKVQEGELICNRAIAQDLVEIFVELYENHYPIEKICLIDTYNGDDEASMQDNNTSCFNYRTVPGKTSLSNHSYGLAIDINPLYNPYVRTKDGELLISPDNAAAYADRSVDFPYKIDKEDLCYQIFTQHGFEWGGAWRSSKDYQHFEKTKN